MPAGESGRYSDGMACRRLISLWASLAVAAVGIGPGTASAATNVLAAGNPNFRSLVDTVTPSVPGLTAEVTDFDNDVTVVNHTGQTVTIQGYQGDPFARILPDGTVELNTNSPAYYLNATRYATSAVPPTATPKATPHWIVIDHAGRYEWHDHRIHLFTTKVPPQVKDQSKTTKIFDWRIPIAAGTQAGAIVGTLYWHGVSSGFPVAAIVALIAAAVLSVGFVVMVRRRRAGGGPPEPGEPPKVREPAKEAW